MKRYSLALILIVLIGTTVGLGLFFLSGRKTPEKAPKSAPLKLVYVNLDSVINLHPDYEVIKSAQIGLNAFGESVRKLDADFNKALVDNEEVEPISPQALGNVLPRTGKSVGIRARLQDKLITDAKKSLTEWEINQRDSLNVRLKSNRRIMMDIVNSEMRRNKRDIIMEAVLKRREAIEKALYPISNAWLKKTVLTSAVDLHGYKPPEIPPKLEKAILDYNTLKSARDNELASIETDMYSTIDSVLADATGRMNSELSKEEVASKRRIENRIKTARTQINAKLTEIAELTAPIEPRPLRKNQVKSLINVESINAAIPANTDIAAKVLRKNIPELLNKFRNDIKKTLYKIADERGERIVFARNQNNISDMTNIYANLLQRKYGLFNRN